MEHPTGLANQAILLQDIPLHGSLQGVTLHGTSLQGSHTHSTLLQGSLLLPPLKRAWQQQLSANCLKINLSTAMRGSICTEACNPRPNTRPEEPTAHTALRIKTRGGAARRVSAAGDDGNDGRREDAPTKAMLLTLEAPGSHFCHISVRAAARRSL